MNLQENARQFAADTRACAMQMMGNAICIQKQLPALDMPDSLRSQIESLCTLLIVTKRNLIREIVEAVAWLESDPDQLDLWIECIRPWILDVMMSINECVEAVQEAVKNGATNPLVSILVTESATNILNTIPEKPTSDGCKTPKNETMNDDLFQQQVDPSAKAPYQVTPLDNFDWYEGAGVPTKCRDAEHALSVAKGILERSLAHEHAQAKNPTDAAELFDRWDSFGDYPSIYPELDPPFNPSEYARQRAEEICADSQNPTSNPSPEIEDAFETEPEQDDTPEDEDSADDCYGFYSEDSYPVGQLIDAIRDVMDRPELSPETLELLRVFLFAMERLPLVTPGVRMGLGLRLDQGGESDWREIRMEDGVFTLGRGTWTEGDADTETVFEVGPGHRDGDAFQASNFALSFIGCTEDVCREVVIDDSSDEPFNGWDLKKDKSRWGSLPCSFL